MFPVVADGCTAARCTVSTLLAVVRIVWVAAGSTLKLVAGTPVVGIAGQAVGTVGLAVDTAGLAVDTGPAVVPAVHTVPAAVADTGPVAAEVADTGPELAVALVDIRSVLLGVAALLSQLECLFVIETVAVRQRLQQVDLNKMVRGLNRC